MCEAAAATGMDQLGTMLILRHPSHFRFRISFWILADEEFFYYKKFSVEQSFIKFLIGTIVRFHRLMLASLKGYIPFTFKGSVSTIPVDILIDKNGVISEVYYGKNTSDHLSFDKIKSFSLNK